MIIKYRDIEIDCTPAAIKAWVEAQDEGAPVGVPEEGESCLVNCYLSHRLREHDLFDSVYVSGAYGSPFDKDGRFVPHVIIGEEEYDQDEPLRGVVGAFDKIKVTSWIGFDATREQTLEALEEAGVW
jgi:hypothetical protein